MVDGCNRMAAFRRVMLSLIAPGMATAIFTNIPVRVRLYARE